METYYYNLSGGINQASTKTELGMNTKNIYWADAFNIEILQNRGIIRQKGNILLTTIPNGERIISMHQMKYAKKFRLLIATQIGNLYVYNNENSNLTKLNKTLSSSKIVFTDFLNGTIVSGLNDKMFFVKNNDSYDIIDCELKDSSDNYVYSDVISVYKGRIWIASGSSLYYSALGSYTDFTTPNDAGYINDFYTDTDDIVALKPYKDYLAIYKEKSVYLLSGSSVSDFAITPFANKGAFSQSGIISSNNKQYFFSNGIFTLEVGELNQILLGEEVTHNIKSEFSKFDKTRFDEVLALDYEIKNQVWYFIPYKKNPYLNVIWINDLTNKAWYKRILPQNITTAAIFNDNILTADNEGNIYKENIGENFNGAAINFMWKSPFLSIGNPTVRKTIDEFYFILDESYDNNFKFSVYKNYDSENQDDIENIYSSNFENLVWSDENSQISLNDCWDYENNEAVWAIDTESSYKAEISEANYSVQLCVEGDTLKNNVAIIGIEFKEIYNED